MIRSGGSPWWLTCVMLPKQFSLCIIEPQNHSWGILFFYFATQSRIHWVQGALSLGVKRPGREAGHSPLYSAEVKNAWRYTSTPTIRLHGVVLRWRTGDNFYVLPSQWLQNTDNTRINNQILSKLVGVPKERLQEVVCWPPHEQYWHSIAVQSERQRVLNLNKLI